MHQVPTLITWTLRASDIDFWVKISKPRYVAPCTSCPCSRVDVRASTAITKAAAPWSLVLVLADFESNGLSCATTAFYTRPVRPFSKRTPHRVRRLARKRVELRFRTVRQQDLPFMNSLSAQSACSFLPSPARLTQKMSSPAALAALQKELVHGIDNLITFRMCNSTYRIFYDPSPPL